MQKRFKEKLHNNGQSLKWFWRNNLKGKISYAYFNMQINDNATMQPVVEKAISKFFKRKEENGKWIMKNS